MWNLAKKLTASRKRPGTGGGTAPAGTPIIEELAQMHQKDPAFAGIPGGIDTGNL